MSEELEPVEVEPTQELPHALEVISEIESDEKPVKKAAKKATKKAAKKAVKKETLLEGQVIGGGFKRTNLLHTKEGKVAKFATKKDAIIAAKRYGGKARQEGEGFIVRK